MMKLVKIVFQFVCFSFHFLRSVIASVLLNKKMNNFNSLSNVHNDDNPDNHDGNTNLEVNVPGTLLNALGIVTHLIVILTL